MVKVSKKNLFIADRSSGHLSIADTTLGHQWQFYIEIYLCIAHSHYSSMQCFCANENIKKTYLLDIKGQTDVWLNF